MAPHWTDGDDIHDRYNAWASSSKSEDEIYRLESRARDAEARGDFSDAGELYRVAGNKEKANELFRRTID